MDVVEVANNEHDLHLRSVVGCGAALGRCDSRVASGAVIG